ncbi:MAG: rhodanese-like domain-containing protein [Flavobacterium sp.]|nr:rhodanese-like domain-containing protein [Flavobacterium sp.]
MNSKIISLFFLLSSFGYAQKSIDKVLKALNNNSVPYISSQNLKKLSEKIILLDAREKNEFEVSHIENAINIGFNKFDINKIKSNISDKNQKIIVYCSIGVRSERIGEKLLKEGYTNVYNLYGGIFDWKNNDFMVVNDNNVETQNIHTYSKSWGKYLIKGNKIY